MGSVLIKVPADFEIPPIPETIRFKVKRTDAIQTLTIQEVPADILELIGKSWTSELLAAAADVPPDDE